LAAGKPGSASGSSAGVAGSATGAGSSASGTAASAAGQSSAGQAPTSLQALIDGARKEGQLNLIWGEGTEGGTPGIQELATGFDKAYGLPTKVQFTPGDSMPNMGAKLIQEYQTKRPATSDLYVGYAVHMAAAAQADALESVAWATWAPNIKDPAMIAGNGLAVGFETSTPGITYNSQKITGSAIPKTMDDLLKPEYKGKIASTPYAANFDLLSMDALWGEQRTVDYLNKFTTQVAGLIRCDETSRVESGEFQLLASDCSQANTYREKAKGGPVNFVIPSDAPLLLPLYLAVPKNAAHPDTAKLWINYLMSREGQDILYKFDQEDSQLVPGSNTAKQLQGLQTAGVKFNVVDLSVMQSQDTKEQNRRRAEVQKILTAKQQPGGKP